MGLKVVLTGEGADENFLGYNIFKETIFRSSWDSYANDDERGKALSALYPYLKHFNKAGNGSLLGMYKQFNEEKWPGMFSHEMRIHNSKMALLKSEAMPICPERNHTLCCI